MFSVKQQYDRPNGKGSQPTSQPLMLFLQPAAVVAEATTTNKRGIEHTKKYKSANNRNRIEMPKISTHTQTHTHTFTNKANNNSS